MQHEVQALATLAKGDKDGAVQRLKKGIEVAESMRPPAGAANPVRPVYELAGDDYLAKRLNEIYGSLPDAGRLQS